MNQEGSSPIKKSTSNSENETSPGKSKTTDKTSQLTLGISKARISNAPLKSRPQIPPLKTTTNFHFARPSRKNFIGRNTLKHSVTPEPWQKFPKQALTTELGYNQSIGKPVTKEYLNGLLRSLNDKSRKYSEEKQALEERIRTKAAMRGNLDYDHNKWNMHEVESISFRRQSYDQADSSFSISTKDIFTRACNYIGNESPNLEEDKGENIEVTPKVTKDINSSTDATTTKIGKPLVEPLVENAVKEEVKDNISKSEVKSIEKKNTHKKIKSNYKVTQVLIWSLIALVNIVYKL